MIDDSLSDEEINARVSALIKENGQADHVIVAAFCTGMAVACLLAAVTLPGRADFLLGALIATVVAVLLLVRATRR